MSDTLKERLASHSNAFEGLLSLIPQKYYYDDESKSQWQRTKGSKAAKAEMRRQKKKAKFDPDAATSARDELHRRSGQSKMHESSDDEPNGPIYDDDGNQVGSYVSDEEEYAEERLQAAVSTNSASEQTRKRRRTKSDSKDAARSTGEKVLEQPALPDLEDTTKEPNPAEGTAISAPLSNSESSAEPVEPSTKGKQPERTTAAGGARPNGIDQLRERLATRINELRAQRKAPGSSAEGAPRNREELLAARQRRKALKGKSVDKDEKRGEPDKASSEIVEESQHKPDSEKGNDNLMFGRLEFQDGSRVDRKLDGIEKQKTLKKRNAADQLKVLENRKAKLDTLDTSKQQEVLENAKWSHAILHSEGAKLKDDEKLLRKTVKQKQKRKQRSEREWRAREAAVTQQKAARDAKRTANIEARKESKLLRKQGKKVPAKPRKGRAGFEGKR